MSADLKLLKASYMGVSGEALITHYTYKRGVALQQLLGTTDHMLMVQAQTEYKIFDDMIKLRETVRKL